MVQKNCERCNTPLGDVHGNRKWCERCKIEIRQAQNRECKQRQRDRDRGGTLIIDDKPSQQIADTLATVNPDPQLHELRSFSAEFLEPLLFSFTQQFHAFQTEVRELLAEKNQMMDEFLYVMVQDPDFRKQLVAREKHIQHAMILITELGKREAPFRIRRILEKQAGLSKRAAEEIMIEAEKRLRTRRARNQRSMEDYS